MKEPNYYVSNGLSPIGAFKQGLISEDEYRGFLIGNIIKYTIRAGKKEDAIEDLKKAKNYLEFYLELLGENKKYTAPEVTIKVNNDLDMDKFREDLRKELEKANSQPAIMEIPTEDPSIHEIKVSDAMYDENGELKPEVKEKLREYIEEKRKNAKEERVNYTK